MDRVAFKTNSFEESEKYDREQQRRMTPDQRLAAARILQQRYYGKNVKDIRECFPKK